MILNSIVFLFVTLVGFSDSQVITTTTPTEPYLTIDPGYYTILQGLVGSQMNLSLNVYEWNVTEVVKLVDAQNPAILTTLMTTGIVFFFFFF